ncbi:Crp/Fnr family transcriptional regulator [Marivita sp. GX14005]|uniref:Crp/Fnr family transcriptional regulator n=1 Tax=Marivita sp. GX14005 TaxID=2942276 RepID=UPI0020187FC8|nr:Crp/Fnr family transcriptional regulator [Marivita sp. GX14005]MCL3883906.1 Crp/Fnr family transcriptional regulator [Marivita sp. GX14005]
MPQHRTEKALPRLGMTRHLPEDRWARLAARISRIDTHAAGTVLSRRGERLEQSLLVLSGIVVRSIPRANGARSTVVALQVPGDFVDLHGFPLKRLDHDVVTLTETEMAVIAHADLAALVDADLPLARLLWSLTLIDASIHRHWAMRNSAMRALGRVANFFCEIDTRMNAVHRAMRNVHEIGLTQADIADACGLTTAHVNRVLRDLREDGSAAFQAGVLHVHDRPALHRLGAFNAGYLYLPEPGAPV